MKNKSNYTITIATSLLLLGGTLNAFAQDKVILSFDQIWAKISQNSAAIQSAQHRAQAAQAAQNRTSRHWLPRLYIDARYYQTNDPGAVFFGALSQRAVTNADFNPDSLNHPDASTFTRGALGLDLPLFEGGSKSTEAAIQQELASAQNWELEQTRNSQFSQALTSYGTLSALQRQSQALRELNGTVERVLKNYQVGSKSNPVGYSGLLGLKSLANRLKGIEAQYTAMSSAHMSALRAMGLDAPTHWQTHNISALELTTPWLQKTKNASSAQLKAAQSNTRAAEKMPTAEQARFLPRVGAFAETYMFDGDRSQEDGYTAGIYLQWNLFNPNDFGRKREAVLNAQAHTQYARALAQGEDAQREGLQASTVALEQSFQLMQESDQLTREQMRVADTLFRNGAINALQLTEVLSRRTDLITQKTDLELQILKTAADKIQNSEFALSATTTQGGQ